MEKEMEGSLQQIMEHLLANQEKTNAEKKVGEAEMETKIGARLERMEAAMHFVRSDIERTVQQHTEALLEGLRSCGERIVICKVESEACPEKSKAGPERMEDAVVTFEGSLDRIESTDVEATPGATEAAVERQKLFKKYRVIGGPVRRSTIGCRTSSWGKEANPRQCWVPAEVIRRPEATDTPRRPCSAKRKCS
jgi:hypothetical protein